MKSVSRSDTIVLEQNALINWIRGHQTLAFFALTFVFSWSLFVIASYVPFDNETTSRRIIGIGAYGPSVSAIMISRLLNANSSISNSRKKSRTGKIILLFACMMILFGAIEWWNNEWWNHPYDASLIVADFILVSLAAIVILSINPQIGEVDSRLSGSAGKRNLSIWIVIALVLWPFLIGTGNLSANLLGTALSPAPSIPGISIVPLLVQSFLWAFLYGGALNEEPGWRGFALPRLQKNHSPLMASIILGTLWGLWHVPLHFLDAYGGGAIGAVLRIQEIPLAIIFTWLYNRSKGSLLAAIILHTSINTVGFIYPRSYVITFVLCMITASIMIFADRMWDKSGEGIQVVNE